MTLTDAEIANRLSKILHELTDPKWGTWRYIEGDRIYEDLEDMANELDVLIGVLNHRNNP
jgi:hypothetical protein